MVKDLFLVIHASYFIVINLIFANNILSSDLAYSFRSSSINNVVPSLVLIEAIESGNIDLAREYIKNNIGIKEQDEADGTTPLMVASLKGYKDLVFDLIKKQKEIDTCDSAGASSLMYACAGGNIEIVQHILLKSPSINRKNSKGCTALMLAAANGHKSIVLELIEQGADLSIINNNKETAYKIALYKGYKDIAHLLLIIDALELNNPNKVLDIIEKNSSFLKIYFQRLINKREYLSLLSFIRSYSLELKSNNITLLDLFCNNNYLTL